MTLDGHAPSRVALWRLRREHVKWRRVKVRTSQYLNNLIEQDHRAIKARLRSTKGLKSFVTAAITLAGFDPSDLMKSTIKDINGLPQLVYEIPLDATKSPALEELDFPRIFDRLIIGPTQFGLPMADAFASNV